MAVTGKHTRYAMESWFYVPARHLMQLVPKGLSPFTKFGIGKMAIGAWNHADAYVDDTSYGPVLEAWAAIGVEHRGRPYGYCPVTYNNSPSYAAPVNTIFKFSKEHAEMEWNEEGGRHELLVSKDGQTVLRFRGRPTFFPKSVPLSKPRLCWLPKGEEQYVAEMSIAPRRSRLALCSVEIAEDGPMKDVASALRWVARFSVFYEDASIVIPEPNRLEEA